MCVAFVLLMNSFYKVYYWLFDLCEHVVAMLLLLGALCLIFTPLLFSVHPSEEQRPLFTIVILVTGVVGGLVIVITVVYFYRFCLRKRPPVTTTGKPEQKREQVRSLAQSQCRPLPIPSLIPHADHNPLYQHFMPQSQQTKPALPEKSVLLDLASDTSKIAQVFPLMTRTPGQPSQKLFETQQAQPVQIQVPIQVQVTKPTIEFQKADSETAPRAPMQTSQQTQKAASQHSSTHFLNVEQPTPYRARSAEFLSPSKGIDDDELRRASFDGTGRRPGTGRQLPSTEHLQPVSDEYVGKMAAPVPQIRTTAPERRRNSYLLRTPAFDNHVLPMKQISAPLPEQQKIYDRGHAHSRSWNPEEECYEASFDYGNELHEPRRQYVRPSPSPGTSDPYKRFYEEMVRLFGENLPVDLKRLTLEAAATQPPPPQPAMDSLGVRQQQQFTRQVKSFDDRSAEPEQRSPKYSGLVDKRSQSESERKQLLRQSTIDMLQSEMNEVSLECQNLWDTRQSLEQNSHLAYQLSTDFSENSASTSFESNTESMQHDSSGGRKGSAGMLLETRSGSGHSADSKRQKYKNLLLHRQLVSNSVYPESTAANFESVCTTGSDSSFMEPINHGASSFDSSRSEMTFGGDLSAELAFKSLANLEGRPMASVKPQKSPSRLPLSNANKNHSRPSTGRGASFDLQRDYSVDSKTDSIFREFSRIDPKYEEPVASGGGGAGRMLPAVGQRPTVTDSRERRQSFGRFRSVDGRPMPIPTIRYSDDQNRH